PPARPGCSGRRGDLCAGWAFFFQAEAGIRRFHVTGVQTCALPILLAVAMTAGAGAVGGRPDGTRAGADAAPAAGALSPGLLTGGDLDAGSRSLRAHLRAQPRDHRSWATLGPAHLEPARTTGHPSHHPP